MLHGVCCMWLSAAGCPLHVVCCMLSVAHCMLHVVGCTLSVACCMLSDSRAADRISHSATSSMRGCAIGSPSRTRSRCCAPVPACHHAGALPPTTLRHALLGSRRGVPLDCWGCPSPNTAVDAYRRSLAPVARPDAARRGRERPAAVGGCKRGAQVGQHRAAGSAAAHERLRVASERPRPRARIAARAARSPAR